MYSLFSHCRSLAIALLRLQFIKSSLKLAMRLPKVGHESPSKVSISDLDQIMDRSKNLDYFLSHKGIQNEYFDALKKYFSSKNISRQFPKKSFLAILDQMKILSKEVPEFREAAWNKSSSENTFRIQVKEQESGRNVNQLLWRLFRYEWLDGLKKKSKGIDHRQIKFILIQTLKRIQNFEEKLKNDKINGYQNFGVKQCHPKTAKILRNSFYENLSQDEALNQVASKLLLDYLLKPQNQIFFELIDADLIFHYFQELRQNPRKLLPAIADAPIPNALLCVIKNLIPDPNALILDHSIFPKNQQHSHKTRNSEYVTLSVRPFHAVWAGIFGKDCLAGDPSHLEKLCVSRWAIPVLTGTQTEFVERNGKYQGFVRTVPLQHPYFSESVCSLEIWVPAMTRSVLMPEGNQSLLTKQTPLFNVWFEKWLNQSSNATSILLMSDSKKVDNEKVKETVFQSEAYRDGVNLPQPHSLTPLGSLIDQLTQVIPIPEAAHAFFYGKIALDTTLKDVTQVKILKNSHPFWSGTYPLHEKKREQGIPKQWSNHRLRIGPDITN